jgi:hypothetical protein
MDSTDALPDFNLNEVSDSFEGIDTGVYILEITKMTYKIITPKSGPNAGKATPIIQCGLMVADDPSFSGRRLEKNFYLDQGPTGLDAKQLKRVMTVTGVTHPPGMPLAEWAGQFEGLIPPARFRVPVEKIASKKEPGSTENRILLLRAEPA